MKTFFKLALTTLFLLPSYASFVYANENTGNTGGNGDHYHSEDGECFPPVLAVATLRGDGAVTGTVYFNQTEDGLVRITGTIRGLDPNAKRGFHIQYVCFLTAHRLIIILYTLCIVSPLFFPTSTFDLLLF